MTKHRDDSRRPIQPGDAAWLAIRRSYATLRQQIAERGLTDREVQYQRLQRMITEAKRSRR